MKKDLVLQSVQSSVSSIFSKEDVINLINSIEESKGRVITTQQINNAIDEVIYWAERRADNLINLDSAEFEINYNNQVELTSVDIDVDSLRDALENNFMDFGEDVEVEDEENKEAIADNEL